MYVRNEDLEASTKSNLTTIRNWQHNYQHKRIDNSFRKIRQDHCIYYFRNLRMMGFQFLVFLAFLIMAKAFLPGNQVYSFSTLYEDLFAEL
jgi:hypothetical protein